MLKILKTRQGQFASLLIHCIVALFIVWCLPAIGAAQSTPVLGQPSVLPSTLHWNEDYSLAFIASSNSQPTQATTLTLYLEEGGVSRRIDETPYALAGEFLPLQERIIIPSIAPTTSHEVRIQGQAGAGLVGTTILRYCNDEQSVCTPPFEVDWHADSPSRDVNGNHQLSITSSTVVFKEKLGIKTMDGSYQNGSFLIADVSEEELKRWRIQNKEPEGLVVSSLVLKVNKENLLKNEKLQIPLNKKEFVDVKRFDLDLENEDSFVWQGSSDSENKPGSNVLLSWYKGHLTGYLNLSTEESYQIKPFKKNYIIIRKINPSFFPKGAGNCTLPLNEKQNHIDSSVGERESAQNNDFFIENERTVNNVSDKIRILFLYRGNEYTLNEITSKVNGYIVSLNTILKGQDISVSDVFETAGIAEMSDDIKSSTLSTVLYQISDLGNVEIQKLRHDYQADLVSILVQDHDGAICGQAFLGGDYLISAITCDSRYTFEHEIGHTLGAQHEREQLREDGHRERSPYAYGYYEKKKLYGLLLLEWR